MKINVKLTGVLKGFVPKDPENKITVPKDGDIEVPEGTDGSQLLELLDLEHQVDVVIIDDTIHLSKELVLQEGSEVTLLGFIGGG